MAIATYDKMAKGDVVALNVQVFLYLKSSFGNTNELGKLMTLPTTIHSHPIWIAMVFFLAIGR